MKKVVGFLFLIVLVVSCKTSANKQEPILTNEDFLKQKSKAVCIHVDAAAYKMPDKTSSIRSTINLGEKISYLGEYEHEQIGGDVFYKVSLSDGMLGWINSSNIVLNSTPATIKTKAIIYERPDITARSLGGFIPLEFVTITETKGDWVKVVGVDKHKIGWINNDNISEVEVDIATSTLAYDSLLSAGVLQVDFIGEFLDNLPYQNSCFVPYLQDKLDSEVARAIENAIEEYERIENVMLE